MASVAVPTPVPGRGVFTGRLFSTTVNGPIGARSVRLAPVFRAAPESEDGAYVLDEGRSPAATTDANGVFVFPDLEVTEYVLLIAVAEGQHELITESSGKPRVWKVDGGQVTNAGEVRVAYP